jgi:stearoyl-CoA desaturase (delta-9 desaturase)
VRQRFRPDWVVILFVTISPVVGIAGLVWWLASGRFHPATLVLALVMAVATGLGITAGYHRLFAHRSYRAVWPVRLGALLFGGAAMEESALKWSWDHRRHHRYVDGDGDPYDISRGFWHAHFLWMFHRRELGPGERWPADLWNDPLVRWQHRLWVPSASLVSFALPAAIAAAWGDAWGGLLVAGVLRTVVNQHLTFSINSFCHRFGSQPYSDRHSARDNAVTALFTYGEGYHNFHHEFGSDYRNGVAAHHYDPSKWLIWTFARLRLANDLRRTQPGVIAARRAAMQAKRSAPPASALRS